MLHANHHCTYRLGEEVESIMQSLIASVGQIGEARLLAMVALILADRASTAVVANGASNAAASTAPPASASADDASAAEDRAAALLEDAAAKIATLTSKLAFDATKP